MLTKIYLHILTWFLQIILWSYPNANCSAFQGTSFQKFHNPNFFGQKASYVYPLNTQNAENGMRYNEETAKDVNTLIYGFVNVEDYEKAAAQILPRNTMTFYEGGAGHRITLEDNVAAFKGLVIKPRSLVDVSKRTLSTNIFGRSVDFPLGVSPVSFLGMASPEGEIAAARAAEAMGSIFTLSTYSNFKIEDIARAAPFGRKWMQVYIFTKRSVTVNLVERAEKNGYEAIVITIDSPVLGNRVDLRQVGYPSENMTLANFGEEMRDYLGVFGRPVMSADVDNILDSSPTWEDVRWLKSITRLPVLVKGILSSFDAERALQYELDGIIISNHGRRQLDSVEATINILPEIVETVNGRCPIIIDGGVRTGYDVFKALALGADMVFAGRPFIWGLAVNGEAGVADIFNIFKDEFNRTMALAGVRSVAEIDKSRVARRVSFGSCSGVNK